MTLSALVQKRLSFIVNIAYFALILAIFYLVFKTFFGVLVPFIVAFLVAAVFDRPVRFIESKTPLKRGMTSVIIVLLSLGVVAGLFFLLGIGLVSRLKDFYNYVIGSLQNISGLITGIRDWLLRLISVLPDSVRLPAADNITVFFNNIAEKGFSDFSISNIGINWSSLLSKGGIVIKDTVGHIPSLLIGFIITIVASVFMLSDFDSIKRFVLRQFPEKKRSKIFKAKALAVSTLKKMLKAYSIIILITMTELCVGLYILKICGIFDSDYIVPISLVIAIIDIIPVLGTGTVLIPWAVYSFITGNVGMGVGLVIIYAVIMVIRQVIEPKLVAGQAGLSPIVTITAMYIGTKTLGVLGFLILPFIVILIKKFNDEGIIDLFKTSDASEDTAAAVSTDAALPGSAPENE